MSASLAKIKQNIESYLGRKVELRADQGRKRVIEKIGVVEGVYPSIFVVKINGGHSNSRTVSYSYSDVLTESVQVKLLDK